MLNKEKILILIDEMIKEAQEEPQWKAELALRCLKKELLKEQEAVKPVVHITNANLTNGADCSCGECGGSFLYKAVNFCPWCGKAVKWNET